MGQLQGKAIVEPGVEPFLNLSRGDVYKFMHFYYSKFDSFILDREGFEMLTRGTLEHRIRANVVKHGESKEEVVQVKDDESESNSTNSVHENNAEHITKENTIQTKSTDDIATGMENQQSELTIPFLWFELFDTENLGRVDILQMLCTIISCSCMDPQDKFRALFGVFDFEDKECLTYDEMVMLFTLTSYGLRNLTKKATRKLKKQVNVQTADSTQHLKVPSVQPEDIEKLATDLYQDSGLSYELSIDFPSFLKYCMKDPLVQSWYNHFEDFTVFKEGSEQHCTTKVVNQHPRWNYPEVESWQRRVLRHKSHISIASTTSELNRLCKYLVNRQWLGHFSALTDTSQSSVLQVQDKLEVEWIFGSTHATLGNSNAFYTCNERVIYPVANFVVMYDPLKHKQFVFQSHQNKVECLAPLPCYRRFVSSEVGILPVILLWDSDTLKVEKRISGFLRRGIASMAVSQNSKFLVALATDDCHTIALYNLIDCSLIYSCISDTFLQSVLFTFNDCFAACGSQLIQFYRIQEKVYDSTKLTRGRNKVGSRSNPSSKGTRATKVKSTTDVNWSPWKCSAQFKVSQSIGRVEDHFNMSSRFTCVGFLHHPDGPLTVSGCDEGYLYAWDGRYCKQRKHAHDLGVNVIQSCQRGLATGGNDGKVRLWTCRMHLVATFDMFYNGAINSIVSSLFWSTLGDKLLVGTKHCQIFELSGITGSNSWPSALVPGHERDAIRAAEAGDFSMPTNLVPIGNGVNGSGVRDAVVVGAAGEIHMSVCPVSGTSEVCTIGRDGYLRLWDLDSKRLIANPLQLPGTATRVCYSPDASKLFVAIQVPNIEEDSTTGSTSKVYGSASPTRQSPRSPIAEVGKAIKASTEAAVGKVRNMLGKATQDEKQEINTEETDEENLNHVVDINPTSMFRSIIVTIRRDQIIDEDESDLDLENFSPSSLVGKMLIDLKLLSKSESIVGTVCSMSVSSNNSMLVVGCSTGTTYVYNKLSQPRRPVGQCIPSFLLTERFNGHPITVSHLEFYTSDTAPADRFLLVCFESEDGLLSDSAGFDLQKTEKRLNSNGLKQFKSFEREDLSNLFLEFPTNCSETSLPFNFGMQGTHTLKDSFLSRRIRSVDVRGAGTEGLPLLVMADNLGTVQLCHYPCLYSTDARDVYYGHTNDVAVARFSIDGTRVISCGGDDSIIIIWRLRSKQTKDAAVSDSKNFSKPIVSKEMKRDDVNFSQDVLKSYEDSFRPQELLNTYTNNGLLFPRYPLALLKGEPINTGLLIQMEYDELRMRERQGKKLKEVEDCFLLGKPCIQQATTPKSYVLLPGEEPEPNKALQDLAPFSRSTVRWISGYSCRFSTNTAQYISMQKEALPQRVLGRVLTSRGVLLNNDDEELGEVEWTTPNRGLVMGEGDKTCLGIAFSAGRTVVLQPDNETTNTSPQKYFDHHTQEVSALAVSPNLQVVATAHVSECASVLIWNASTLELLNVLEGVYSSAITLLSFSSCGTFLGISGFDAALQNVSDGPRTVSVFRWATGELVGKTGCNEPQGLRYERKDLVYESSNANGKATQKRTRESMVELNGKYVQRSQLFGLSFVPRLLESKDQETDIEVVACGVGQIEWHTWNTVTKEFETCTIKSDSDIIYTCVAWIPSVDKDGFDCIVGTDQGNLVRSAKNGLIHSYNGHCAPITCAKSLLLPYKNSSSEDYNLSNMTGNHQSIEFVALVTSTVQGDITVWDKELKKTHKLHVFTKDMYVASPIIRSLDTLVVLSTTRSAFETPKYDLKILAGTNGGQIFEFAIPSPQLPWETEPEESGEMTDKVNRIDEDKNTSDVEQTESEEPKKNSQTVEPSFTRRNVVTGHSPGTLHQSWLTGLPRHRVLAIASHPRKPIVCTGSDAGVILLWNTSDLRLVNTFIPKVACGSEQVCGKITALAYSANGNQLAVGFGMEVATPGTKDLPIIREKPSLKPDTKGTEGTIIVYDAKSLEVLGVITIPQGSINDIKYSRDGSFLSAASQDGVVYTFRAKEDFATVSQFTGHQSPPSHLDFADDSEIVRSSCSHAFENGASTNDNLNTYEIRLFDAISGNEIPTPEAVRSKTWTTEQIPIEWNYRGAWTTRENLITSCDISYDRKWVVTGNLYGGVELALMPRRHKDDAFHKICSHVGPVGQVRFVVGNVKGRFVSLGASDGCFVIHDCPNHPNSQPSSTESNTSREVRRGIKAQLAEQMSRLQCLTVNPAFEYDPPGNSLREWCMKWEAKRISKLHHAQQQVLQSLVKCNEKKYIEDQRGEEKRVEELDPVVDDVLRCEIPPAHFQDKACTVNNKGGIQGHDKVRNETSTEASKDTEPELNATLEFLYGYLGEGAHNNICYTPNGSLLYNCGAVCVAYDPSKQSQYHMFGHQSHISRLIQCPSYPELVVTSEIGWYPDIDYRNMVPEDVNSKGQQSHVETDMHSPLTYPALDGEVLASGSYQDRIAPETWWGQIRVWHVPTLNEISSFPGHHKAPVVHIAISNCGKVLISVDKSEPCNHMAVWVDGSQSNCWKTPIVTSTASLPSNSQSLFVVAMTQACKYVAVTSTSTGMYFWRRSNSSVSLEPHLVNDATNADGCSPNNVVHTVGIPTGPNGMLTGTSLGSICVWEGTVRLESFRAHSGSITCLRAYHSELSTEPYVLSGGDDGLVQMWRLSDFSLIQSFDLCGAKPAPSLKAISSTCVDALGVKLVVGCASGEVYEILMNSGQISQLLQSGHATGGLHGLAAHPKNPKLFVTGGDGAALTLWDAEVHRQVQTGVLDAPTRAINFSNSGEEIAVGYGIPRAIVSKSDAPGAMNSSMDFDQSRIGNFVVVNVESFEVVHEGKASQTAITELKYSPDSKSLSVAAGDGSVYIHSVSEGYAMRSKCVVKSTSKKNKAKPIIRHFDYSDDSKLLRAQAKEQNGKEVISYYSMPRGSKAKTDPPRGQFWHNPTCTVVGQQSAGIIHASCAITTPAGVRLVAEAHDCQIVIHFSGAGTKRDHCGSVELVIAHGHAIQALQFSCDGTRLFSVGGRERVIAQWSLVFS